MFGTIWTGLCSLFIWRIIQLLIIQVRKSLWFNIPFTLFTTSVSSIPDGECWKVYNWWQREPHLRLSQPCFWQSVWSSSYTAPRSDPDHLCDAQRSFSWQSYWENNHWPWEPFPQHIPCYMWTFSELCYVRTCITYILCELHMHKIIAQITTHTLIPLQSITQKWAGCFVQWLFTFKCHSLVKEHPWALHFLCLTNDRVPITKLCSKYMLQNLAWILCSF